jgi:hypothetical protein
MWSRTTPHSKQNWYTPSVDKKMSQICQNLDVSRPDLVYIDTSKFCKSWVILFMNRGSISVLKTHNVGSHYATQYQHSKIILPSSYKKMSQICLNLYTSEFNQSWVNLFRTERVVVYCMITRRQKRLANHLVPIINALLTNNTTSINKSQYALQFCSYYNRSYRQMVSKRMCHLCWSKPLNEGLLRQLGCKDALLSNIYIPFPLCFLFHLFRLNFLGASTDATFRP